MKSRTFKADLYVEYQRIEDKKTAFRSSKPDSIYVRVIANIGNNQVILREQVFTDATMAKGLFEQIKQALS